MIQKDFFIERKDGVKLYRTYSDRNMMIQKGGTEEIYSEAIDVENSGFEYTETDISIEPTPEPETDLTLDDTLKALNEMGVDTND